MTWSLCFISRSFLAHQHFHSAAAQKQLKGKMMLQKSLAASAVVSCTVFGRTIKC